MTSTRFQKLIDALKAAGSKVHKRGKNSIQAQCPVHEDNQASMSIKEQNDGKILINCHAGCQTGNILKKLGFKFDILFPDDDSGSKKKDRKIVATYPYVNENGDLLFEAIRFHPKDFRQRQPATGGGWKWNLKGVRRVIYNLPEVLEACKGDRPIFLCEGEKDADALIKRDIVATTCPMGAGKWRDEYNEFFEGGEVIILPDNDKSGKDHAIEVTAGLVDHAKKVRILQLPGLKKKEDVSDWLMEGGTREELLELAFDTEPVKSQADAEVFLDMDTEVDEDDPRNIKNQFFNEGLKIYANDENERVIADFNIDIQSIVKDAQEGRIFYVKIRELDRGVKRVTDTIEITPDSLDDMRSFYKAIRPYSMGEILQYRSQKTKPLRIFKWLMQNFDKPIVHRPDHVGHTKVNGRPFWIFGNALICPSWKDHEAKLVTPNEADEYIVNDKLGFTLPVFENEAEKEQLVPFVNTDLDNADAFMGEIKEKLIRLIGGGDPEGRAENYGKLLLAYVIYHLYEEQLYHANDINGHTIIFYVHGPKGTGKTTYFGTVLRAFFGLHKTKELKGNDLSIPGLENTMGLLSRLPANYDEFNPEESNVSHQHLNSYYHRTSRSVSDVDRKNRNKFTRIRSTLTLTLNFGIDPSIDQAETTESRVIKILYKKEYRSDNDELFEWAKDNLDEFSKFTVYLLLNQTDEKRKEVKEQATKLYRKMKSALNKKTDENPKKYNVEHRLTDNYTRLLACFELIYGRDNDFRKFIFTELLNRFEAIQTNNKENALLNELMYLASSGRLKESWHYHYSTSKKELYINLNQCYQTYAEYKRQSSMSLNQFRKIMKDYFKDCGGAETGTRWWYGSYYDRENNKQDVDKAQHSYILTFDQVNSEDMLIDLFPPNEEQSQHLKREKKDEDKQDYEPNIDFEDLDEPPF